MASPLGSSVYLVDSDWPDPSLSSASKTQDLDNKSAAVGLTFFLVAVGVIGLTTFLVVQMTRSGDSGSEEFIGSNAEGDSDGEDDGAELASARGSRTRIRVPEVIRYKTPRWTRTSATRKTRPRRTKTRRTTTQTTTTKFPLTGPQLAAHYINMSLNWRYNPCDDFYSFVCSTFEGAINAFQRVAYLVRKENQEVLLNTTVPSRDQNAAQKGAAMYKACVQIGSSVKNSQVEAVKAFLRLLDLEVSSMPSDPDFDVVDRMTQLSFVYGLPALVEFTSFIGVASIRFISMKYHKRDEEWIINNHVRAANVEGQARFYGGLLHTYDRTLNTASLGMRIVKAEDVVRLFVETLREDSPRRTVTTIVSMLSQYTENSVSKARWEEMITSYSNHTFNASSPVLVMDHTTAIVELLMNNTRLSRDDSRLLVAWCVLRRLLAIAHGREIMRRAIERYYKYPDPVGLYCYQEVLNIMELALTARYLSIRVPPSALATVRQMLRDMTRALQRKLHLTAWFKDPLRTAALREAKAFNLVVGFPNKYYNKSEVEALYVDYPDVAGDFVAAYLKIKRLLAYRQIRGKEAEQLHITIPNASYQYKRHLITVNFGIVQPPLFIMGAPAAMNYGAIGQVLAHEAMHAFDVSNINKDHRGEPITQDISKTLAEYEKRGLCLRASYQRAESESRARALNPLIDSEGIVDYAGLQLAYDAFRHLSYENRTETVPAVGLSPEQTFFVAHCIKWCQADKTSRLRAGTYWNLRSRCIVPLQNMPEFADAFSCRTGNYMNPADKCDFWQSGGASVVTT